MAPPQILSHELSHGDEYVYDSNDSALIQPAQENRSHFIVQSQKPVIHASQINPKKSKSYVQTVGSTRRKPSLNRNNIQEHNVEPNLSST